MKYYLYISDAKINMLLQQIPHEEKKKIASEFKIDLKILGATWKKESEDEQGRISRLEAVCEFINTFGKVGGVDKPSDYIADTLSMRWNTYTFDNTKSELVCFGGITGESTIVLTGSIYHLIGSSIQPKEVNIQIVGPSHLPPIVNWLRDMHGAISELKNTGQRPHEDYWLESAFHLAQSIEGPQQNLEFLAKRLFEGDYHSWIRTPKYNTRWHVVVGTPLYVAMTD